MLVRATCMYGVVFHAHPVHGESHNQCNTTGEVVTVVISVATSDVLTSDLMFSEKFLMSDVLATNLMLTGLLFLFTTIPVLLGFDMNTTSGVFKGRRARHLPRPPLF